MKKTAVILFALILVFTLSGCSNEKYRVYTFDEYMDGFEEYANGSVVKVTAITTFVADEFTDESEDLKYYDTRTKILKINAFGSKVTSDIIDGDEFYLLDEKGATYVIPFEEDVIGVDTTFDDFEEIMIGRLGDLFLGVKGEKEDGKVTFSKRSVFQNLTAIDESMYFYVNDMNYMARVSVSATFDEETMMLERFELDLSPALQAEGYDNGVSTTVNEFELVEMDEFEIPEITIHDDFFGDPNFSIGISDVYDLDETIHINISSNMDVDSILFAPYVGNYTMTIERSSSEGIINFELILYDGNTAYYDYVDNETFEMELVFDGIYALMIGTDSDIEDEDITITFTYND